MNICVSCTDGLSKAGENDINVAFSSVETEIDTYKEIANYNKAAIMLLCKTNY